MNTKALPLALFFLIAAVTGMWSQPMSHLGAHRLDPSPTLEPFYHGVASGDPLSNAVIIWTRVTTDSMTIDVDWQMALDTGMVNIVQSGSVTTDASKDYTVKVDVMGLQPYTTYYYEFTAEGRHSVRGRTRTTPVGMVDSLRFAVMSCASFGHGYFNVYRQIADRNDIDALIHLGDYIYEYADLEFGFTRNMVPTNEIINLSDYRMRHSHYKLDADLRAMHQQYPMFSVWDDHETANNSWVGGAENHNPGDGEGDWLTRKSVAIQAYFEWMPLRMPDPMDDDRIYRKVKYGELAELYMIDTRLEGRDEQGGDIDDPNKKLLGDEQFDWLVESMDTSSSQWQVLCQQVIMAPIEAFGLPINTDSWDGYRAERSRLFDEVINRGIENMVVLSGDFHTGWANDLPLDNYDPDDGSNSAGVEFVTTSITSLNFPVPIGENLIQLLNQHVKYVDLDDKGYYILDINQQRTQADYYHIDGIDSPGQGQSYDESWLTDDGSMHLSQGNSMSTPPNSVFSIPAPPDPRPPELMTSVEEPVEDLVLLGAYPNPFYEDFAIQYFVREAGKMEVMLIDVSGKMVYSEDLGHLNEGIWRTRVIGNNLPAGSYFVVLKSENGIFQRMVVKI
ncbi:MAG: alkaline phosphatase D family protein [Bacteroidota bacterium]